MTREFMDWKECERSFIRKASIDKAKISSLLEASAKRVRFLESIPSHGDNASFIVEGYYEAIKELLTALLLKHGMRSSNHQCLISYFYKAYPEHEGIAHFLLLLNHIRNRLNYYGELVESGFYAENKGRMHEAVSVLTVLACEGGK